MDIEQIRNDYYEAREAAALLGISRELFFYYVKKGRIERTDFPPRRHGFYKKSVIDRMAQGKKRAPERGFVDWIKSEHDVLASLQLDHRVYDEEVPFADLPYYVARVKRNPHVALAVYDSPRRERILSYLSLIPLDEQVILEIMRHKRPETAIRTEEVLTYKRPGVYTLLAESACVDPQYPESFNLLLRHLAEYWCEQYPERQVSKIYAQALTPAGDILIQKLFFSPLYDLAPDAHMLDLRRPSASRVVRSFQRCIAAKEKAHEPTRSKATSRHV